MGGDIRRWFVSFVVAVPNLVLLDVGVGGYSRDEGDENEEQCEWRHFWIVKIHVCGSEDVEGVVKQETNALFSYTPSQRHCGGPPCCICGRSTTRKQQLDGPR